MRTIHSLQSQGLAFEHLFGACTPGLHQVEWTMLAGVGVLNALRRTLPQAEGSCVACTHTARRHIAAHRATRLLYEKALP